jgi:hypothetical protein
MRGARLIDGAEYEKAIQASVRLNDTLRREEAFGSASSSSSSSGGSGCTRAA